jgi:hypothetical protein
MGCCPNKPSAVPILSDLSHEDLSSLSAHSCPSSSNPNRLIEFEDDDIMMRLTRQCAIESNIRLNSLQFDPGEFCRRPDACTMTLLTPQILSEVEEALIKYLSSELSLLVINSGGHLSFNAAQFK